MRWWSFCSRKMHLVGSFGRHAVTALYVCMTGLMCVHANHSRLCACWLTAVLECFFSAACAHFGIFFCVCVWLMSEVFSPPPPRFFSFLFFPVSAAFAGDAGGDPAPGRRAVRVDALADRHEESPQVFVVEGKVT